ncbi:pseudouridine synthase [Paucilactobacillus sp. N302-9]
MRLDKYLHDQQFGTRSEIKKLVKQKRVMINQQVITNAGQAVVTNDQVFVDQQLVTAEQAFYFLLNKPVGTLTATKDESQRTVMQLLKPNDRRNDLFPVGRLDKDTTGMLLITNQGQLAHLLLSPKRHVDKTYIATVTGQITNEQLEKLMNGVTLKNGDNVQAVHAKIIDLKENQTVIKLTIQQGMYHQIKRMVAYLGQRVLSLHREQFANLMDSNLKVGSYRPLTKKEIHQLKQLVNFTEV